MEQKPKSDITQQLILDKAFDLFYQYGFKTTSVDTIMAETKLSKGAFYHHFKNKNEIGLAVISKKIQQRIYLAMVAPLYESTKPYLTLEVLFSERLLSFSTPEKEMGCPANNFINEIGNFNTAYQLALKRIIEEWKNAIVFAIEEGKKNAHFKQIIDSNATAMYLISAFEGIRGIRKLYQDDAVLKTYLQGLTFYLSQLK